MPINALIPLSGNQMQSPVQMQTEARRNQLMQLELQEAQRQTQGMNSLRGLYGDPSFNPEDPNSIKRVGQIDPRMAQSMQTNALHAQAQRSTISRNEEVARREEAERYVETMLPVGRSTLAQYDDAIRRGVPMEQAAQQAQAFYAEQVEQLEKEGSLSKRYLDAAKAAKFNPFTFKARIQQAEGILGIKPETKTPHVKEFKEGNKIVTKQWDADKGQWVAVPGAVAPRSTKAAGGGDGSGGGGGGSGSGVALPKGVTEFVDPKSGKYYAVGKGLSFAMGADGKWKSINRNDIPTKIVKVGTAAAGQGAREAVFTQRKIGSANQATADLQNIVLLPIETERGAYQFGTITAPSFMDATKVMLGNKITPESGQIYSRMAAGLQRSLATIEAQGLMPSGSLTHQMDAVLWKPGDTVLSKLHGLAQIRQIIDAQMEVELHNPRISEDEKDLIRDMIKKVHKAVPFTHETLIELNRSKSKGTTLRDIMKSQKIDTSSEKTDKVATAGRDFSGLWSKSKKRGSVSPGNVNQGEDPDDDADKNRE